MQDVPKIVVSGGPCAGKTTALAAISQKCQELGFTPVIVPEAATTLIMSGFDPHQPVFQEFVIREILHAEALRQDAVAVGHFTKPVLIYDRGLCDGKAYVSEEEFAKTLALFNLSLVSARDHYNGVIFLRSAAVGAEDFYTLTNNHARRESVEEARALDVRTMNAWVGTPHLSIIENRPGQSFETKIYECVRALTRILGVPEPLEKERKFLVSHFTPEMLPRDAVGIDIVQTYLISNDGQTERVRARGQHDRYCYFHTVKRPVAKGVVQEHDRLISLDEYQDFLIRRDHRLLPIHKRRYCFVHDGHYCELDVFRGHREGLVLLEIEVEDMEASVSLPHHVGRFHEVTGDPHYSNYSLSSAV